MKKTFNLYERKAMPFKPSDFDEGTRKVAGYFSAFGVKDSDDDIIARGAFAKSINDAGPASSGTRKIQHLRMHDWAWQIGKLLELREDEYGLYFVSQMGRSQAGEDAFLDYQDGIITEHSIGFNYIPDKIKWVDGGDKAGGHFLVSEVRLWEGSAVTFGANQYTPVVAVAKSGDASAIDKELARLQERSQVLAKVLRRSGKGTDERFLNIEAELLSLTQQYSDFVKALSLGPAKPPKPEAEPKNEGAKSFLIHLMR